MKDRLLSFLGLAQKAGKLALGNDAVENSINSGKAKLLIFASDASNNTKKSILKLSENRDVKILNLNRTKNQIAYFLNREYAVISIQDKSFSDQLEKLFTGEDII